MIISDACDAVRYSPFTVHSYLETQILYATLLNNFIFDDGCNKYKEGFFALTVSFFYHSKVSLRFVPFHYSSSRTAISHLSFLILFLIFFLVSGTTICIGLLLLLYFRTVAHRVFQYEEENWQKGNHKAFDIWNFKYNMELNFLLEIDETMNIYLPVFHFMNRKS